MLGTPAGASALEAAFTAVSGTLAPATRARHLSALRSAITWWAEVGWVTGDPTAGWARPKVPVDTTRALTRAHVTAIRKLDVPLRDKALWRMLYETAARAEEVLGLDVPDLDMPSKRGRVISKDGSTDWVHWQTGTALLRPRPDCCRYRRVDLHAVSEAAIRIALQAQASGTPPEDAVGAIAPASCGLDGDDLDDDDPRDQHVYEGRYRITAMRDTGVRRTVILRPELIEVTGDPW